MRIRDIHPDYILMALMAFALFVELYAVLPSFRYIEYFTPFAIIGFAAEVTAYSIGIIVLALSKHEGLHRCLFIGALVYSVPYFRMGWNFLFETYSYFEQPIPIFIEGVLMLIVGILIVFNVITYIRRLSNSTSMIFYALVASLALEIVMLFSSYRVIRDFGLFLQINCYDIPTYALCIFLLFIVNKKSVKSQTTLFAIRKGFSRIEASVFYQGLTVERSVVEKIMDLDGGNLWCDRYEFAMNSFEAGDYKAVMTKDGDRTHVMITSKDDMTGMNGYRFDLRGVLLDTGDLYTCDTVRLYDEDGFFIQLIVSEEYIDKNRKQSIKERLDLESIV